MQKLNFINIIKLLFLAFVVFTSVAVTVDAIVNGSNL